MSVAGNMYSRAQRKHQQKVEALRCRLMLAVGFIIGMTVGIILSLLF